jgi:hypothetical protein
MGMYTGTVEMAITINLSDAQHLMGHNPTDANEKINFAKYLLFNYANDLFKIVDVRIEYKQFKKEQGEDIEDEEIELSDESDVFGLS